MTARAAVPLLALFVLLLAGPAAGAQDEAPPPAQPADEAADPGTPDAGTTDPTDPEPAIETGPVDEATGFRVHPRALELLRRTESLIYRPQDAGLKSFAARLVMPGTPLGSVAADLSWTAGPEGGTDARVAVELDEKIPEYLHKQMLAKLEPVAQAILPERLTTALRNAHLDWLAAGGKGAVVVEYTNGSLEGRQQVLRFDPDTGVPTSQSMTLPNGVSLATSQRYEPAGERFRMTGMTTTQTLPGGRSVSIEADIDWFTCGDLQIPWRFVQRTPMGEVTFLLEGVVVNGTGFATPLERKAEEATPPDSAGDEPREGADDDAERDD